MLVKAARQDSLVRGSTANRNSEPERGGRDAKLERPAREQHATDRAHRPVGERGPRECQTEEDQHQAHNPGSHDHPWRVVFIRGATLHSGACRCQR